MEGIPADRPDQKGQMMLGYEATLTPLEKGAYLFELALVATDGGTEQGRTVRREVIELMPVEDLEMTFVGCVVTHILTPARMRNGR